MSTAKHLRLALLFLIVAAFLVGASVHAQQHLTRSTTKFSLESTGLEAAAEGTVTEVCCGTVILGYDIDGTVRCSGLAKDTSYSVWVWYHDPTYGSWWISAGSFVTTRRGTGQLAFEAWTDNFMAPVVVTNANNSAVLATPGWPYF